MENARGEEEIQRLLEKQRQYNRNRILNSCAEEQRRANNRVQVNGIDSNEFSVPGTHINIPTTSGTENFNYDEYAQHLREDGYFEDIPKLFYLQHMLEAYAM